MIDILRLAKDLEVNFAFPTQTVHLFQEQAKPEHMVHEKYLDEGIGKAKNLGTTPFSLKNPRSNANDEEQFGKNDIGV
jgi:MscS family membrane protein